MAESSRPQYGSNRFRTPGKIFLPGRKRTVARAGKIEGRTAGSTTVGQAAPMSTPNLLGPRISHIGTGSLMGTYMLGDLQKSGIQQAQLFRPKNIRSEARQSGRPLGYGTTGFSLV